MVLAGWSRSPAFGGIAVPTVGFVCLWLCGAALVGSGVGRRTEAAVPHRNGTAAWHGGASGGCCVQRELNFLS